MINTDFKEEKGFLNIRDWFKSKFRSENKFFHYVQVGQITETGYIDAENGWNHDFDDVLHRSVVIGSNVRKDVFELFLQKPVPEDIFNNYVTDKNGEGLLILQDFCINNMKREILNWCTGIGIIEACEYLYRCAVENGNIKID